MEIAVVNTYFKKKEEHRVTNSSIILTSPWCFHHRRKRVVPKGCKQLPLPPKVDGGNVFTQVCLSVCLSVCEQGISRSYGRIWTKLGGQVGCGTRPNCLDFGEDLDADLDTRNLTVILHH